MFENNKNIKFKTFRCNNQNGLDRVMTTFCQNLQDGKVLNESTSAFYIPLHDLPQELSASQKESINPATANYLNVNKVEQPIQFVGTIMYLGY